MVIKAKGIGNVVGECRNLTLPVTCVSVFWVSIEGLLQVGLAHCPPTDRDKNAPFGGPTVQKRKFGARKQKSAARYAPRLSASGWLVKEVHIRQAGMLSIMW